MRRLLFLLFLLIIPALVQAQYIDRILRGCASGAAPYVRVLTASNGDVQIVTCTGGQVTINGVPIVPGGGLTNSAPLNVVTKSDGTNLVSSSFTDDAATVQGTEPIQITTSNQTFLISGLGTGPGNFLGDWTTPPHTAQYYGVGGSGTFQNLTGVPLDVEGYGGQFTTRIASTNTGDLNNDTSGIAGAQTTWKTLTGATGTITRMVGVNTLAIPAAVGAIVTNAIGFQFQGISGAGPITNAAAFASPTLTAATNNTQVLLGSTTPPAGNWAINDSTGYPSTFGGRIIVAPSVTLLGDGTQSVLKASATFPSVLTGPIAGVNFTFTGAGSSVQNVTAQSVTLAAGYTGAASTTANSTANFSGGTGNDFVAGSFNAAVIGSDRGTTTGDNIGVSGVARDGNFSVGIVGKSIVSKNSATNIGVAGLAQNSGVTPVQVGGYFSLLATKPTLTSAGLIASNGSTVSPIFLAEDNLVPVFTIADGGAVTATGLVNATGGLTVTGTCTGCARSILSINFGASIFSAATTFTAPGDTTLLGQGAEPDAAYIMPAPGILKNLNIRTGATAAVGTPSWILTVRKNGVDTTLTVTGPLTANTTVTDSTHAITFVAGDVLTLSIIVSGAGTTADFTNATMEFDSL